MLVYPVSYAVCVCVLNLCRAARTAGLMPPPVLCCTDSRPDPCVVLCCTMQAASTACGWWP